MSSGKQVSSRMTIGSSIGLVHINCSLARLAYVWHVGIHAAEVARGLEASGFVFRAQIIWAEQHFALSRGDYHWQHEPCWYAVREGCSSNWSGDRKQAACGKSITSIRSVEEVKKMPPDTEPRTRWS